MIFDALDAGTAEKSAYHAQKEIFAISLYANARIF